MPNNRWTRLPLPPDLKKPEIEVQDFEGTQDSEQRERKRWGLLDEYLQNLFIGLITIGSGDTCDCFRWIYQTTATVDDTGLGAQAIFVLPANAELEDNEYQLVIARNSFEYHNIGYTIVEATNTITFVPGILLGECITIYALKHDDVQEVRYEQDTVGAAAPYVYAPPITVDRAPGRQLVFARNSARFLDSGRPGDEYTVSNTLNQLSLTAGLGLDNWSMFCRLRECGVLWHEEILATALGQTVFTPDNPGNVVNAHQTLRMIVAQRTSPMNPGFDFVTNPGANTITINAPGLAIGQPLNVWMYR